MFACMCLFCKIIEDRNNVCLYLYISPYNMRVSVCVCDGIYQILRKGVSDTRSIF